MATIEVPDNALKFLANAIRVEVKVLRYSIERQQRPPQFSNMREAVEFCGNLLRVAEDMEQAAHEADKAKASGRREDRSDLSLAEG